MFFRCHGMVLSRSDWFVDRYAIVTFYDYPAGGIPRISERAQELRGKAPAQTGGSGPGGDQ